jgi:hypothetical protein
MIYLSSALVGVGVMAVATWLFVTIPALNHFDGRRIIENYPAVSVPVMIVLFVGGFLWQLRREKQRRAGA